MAIKTFNSGEVLTAADTNTYLANSGLVYITSTTVGSAVSSVTVSNCFTSTYDNYKVMFSNIDCTTDGNIFTLQLTTSGTASTANYVGNTFYVSTGATSGLTNAGLAASYFEVCSVSNTSTASGMVDIFQPFLAQWTRLMFHPSLDDFYFRFGAGLHKVTTSYDGFKLALSAGTMTGGTITVYGYRKA